MTKSIKPYLQLVRLPNLFTAAADSLAGWLLVRGTLEEPRRWVPLVLASVSIYAAGIVLNDVFDVEIDRRERPNRPLPSGRVSWKHAAWFGGFALVLGPALAALSGSMASFLVALALAACVLSYDGGLKRTLLGPEAMGACRGLNLLLGLSQAPEMGGPAALLLACSLGLFVVGVTWISRSEVDTGKTRGLIAGLIIQNMAMAGILTAVIKPDRFPLAGPHWSILSMESEGFLVLFFVAAVVNMAGLKAYWTPIPQTFQKAVKTGVLSLVWLDVAAVAAVRGPGPALYVAVLWVPAFLLGKWLYST